THTHTHRLTHTDTHTNTHMHRDKRTHRLTHTPTHTHTHTHSLTHSLTHSPTHTCCVQANKTGALLMKGKKHMHMHTSLNLSSFLSFFAPSCPSFPFSFLCLALI